MKEEIRIGDKIRLKWGINQDIYSKIFKIIHSPTMYNIVYKDHYK